MSIMADIQTTPYGDIVIHLKGRLNYEVGPLLKKELFAIRDELPCSIIFLDFEQIEFIGSSGLGQFVEMVNELNKNYLQLKITNIRLEFIKVFELYHLNRMDEVIPEEERVVARRRKPTRPIKRAQPF